MLDDGWDRALVVSDVALLAVTRPGWAGGPLLGTTTLATGLVPAVSRSPAWPEPGGHRPGGPRSSRRHSSVFRFPNYYEGVPLFYEWTRDYVKELLLNDATASVRDIRRFCRRWSVDNPMDMEFGPDGALYVLEYGDGFFAENPDAQLSKINFVRGNRTPIRVQVSGGAAERAPPRWRSSSPAPGPTTRTATRSPTPGTSSPTARSTGRGQPSSPTPPTRTASLKVTDRRAAAARPTCACSWATRSRSSS